MITERTDSKTYFRALSILNGAMAAGVVLFSAITAFLIATGAGLQDEELMNLFQYIAPVLTAAGLLASRIVFKNKLKQLHESEGMAVKMTGYRGALILKYAFLEAPAIFAVICTFLTGKLFFLAYTAVLVVLMLYPRPVAQTAVNDLELTENEAAVLLDPDGKIE